MQCHMAAKLKKRSAHTDYSARHTLSFGMKFKSTTSNVSEMASDGCCSSVQDPGLPEELKFCDMSYR